jgi:hypothetical protein
VSKINDLNFLKTKIMTRKEAQAHNSGFGNMAAEESFISSLLAIGLLFRLDKLLSAFGSLHQHL